MTSAVRGFPVTKNDLVTWVKHILQDVRAFGGIVSRGVTEPTWLKLFMKRYPDITERMVKKLTRVRAGVT